MFATVRASLVVLLLFASVVFAQAPSGTSADQPTEVGGYQVQQTIELGYRFVDRVGSQQSYNTFIDQREGPRLLEQSLSFRSPRHTGVLFDDLYVNSFGWGGDPENVARARVSKYRLYDFSAMFRRDYNRFDYPLLANPLNPPDQTATHIPVNLTPHRFDTARRMYDLGLTVLPQSNFSVRLGYTRNRNEGHTFSTFHEGTDVLLNQPWNYTSNDFRIGFDLKFIPKTVISYDQFVSTYKNDTNASLAQFATFPLPNGAPVELGLPWNLLAASPCTVPFVGGFVNPVCNGYFNYFRNQRVRTTTPTEQLSITTNIIPRVNLLARGSYSSGDTDTPYFEFFDGFVARTAERQFTFSGPARVRRISTSAEFGATIELTGWMHLNNSFRLDNWRIPGSWNSIGTINNGASLLDVPGPTITTPAFITSLLKHNSYQNTIQLEFAPSKRFGAHIGYRFRHRNVFHATPEAERGPGAAFADFDEIEVNDHGALAGIWVRPTDELRFNFDVEASSADNQITRISPRQKQNYRGRVNYKATDWATLGGTVNFWESRNSLSDIRYRQHYRNAGFIITLLPNERFSLDLSSNFTDALQNSFICYNGTFLAPGTIPNGCPTFDPAQAFANNNPNWLYSRYEDTLFDFNGSVNFSPVRRVRLSVGYGVVNATGITTILNPLQPTGTLKFTFQRPSAAASFEVVRNVSLNAYWNYDQYNEDTFVGPTAPRYFHSNRAVVSARYAF